MLPLTAQLLHAVNAVCYSHPSWINIKPHDKGPSISVPFTQYIPAGFQQKTSRHAKMQKIKFEQTKASIGTRFRYNRMLEKADQKFKRTMLNTLRALLEKVDSMQKQTVNTSREKETLKNQTEMVEIIEMKNAWTQLNKGSVSLKIQQQKLPKLKCTEKN